MFIRADKKVFLDAIAPNLCAIASRAANAALCCLYLKARGDGEVTVMSFDMTKGVRTAFPAQILEEGEILLDALKLSSMVRSLPDGEFVISSDANFVTTISAGPAKFEILGMSAQAWPSMPMLSGEKKFTIPQGILKKMIQQVIFSCAVVDLKPILTAVLFESHGNTLRMCGCDGYRIALRDEECIEGLKIDVRFLVPARTLQELIRLLSDEEDLSLRIELAGRHVIFAFEDFVFFSRYVDGEYIDYQKSLPKEYRTRVKLKVEDAIACFERCSLLIDQREKSAIHLSVNQDGVKVKCTTRNGKIDEEIPCQVEGENMLVGFNNKYLLEALRGAASCGQEEIVFELTSPLSGMAIRSPQTDAFYYMVVPMRLLN